MVTLYTLCSPVEYFERVEHLQSQWKILFNPLFFSIKITFQLIVWLLPTFFWPGEPLPVEPIPPLNLVGGKFPEDPNAEAKGRYT